MLSIRILGENSVIQEAFLKYLKESMIILVITIKNTQFTSDIGITTIMNVMTKLKMSGCVREAFAPRYQPYLEIAERGAKLPSKKQIRMMTALGSFLDGK